MAGRFSVETVFKAVDRVTAPVSRMQQRVGKFTRSMERGLRRVDRITRKISSSIKKYGAAVAASMAVATGAMANVAGTGMDFEQTMVNAAVKFPGEIRKGTAAFAALEAEAKRVGETTEFSASQAASGLNFLAMAGLNADQSIAALPGLVDMATAAQVGLGEASDIATDSLGAFNLMTKDSAQLQKNLARVSDVLTLTTVRANTSLEDMFEAIKDGAPVATAAGASVETVAAMIGTMANAGIKGSRAGTAMKNIFLAMSAPTSQAAAVFKRLKVATTDAEGNMRDAMDVFQDFLKVTGGMSESARLRVFDKIFGKIPIAAAINLTNAAGSMAELRKELETSSGITADMAKTMRDTALGRWKSLLSVVESIQIRIFGEADSPFAKALDRTILALRNNSDTIVERVGGAFAFVLNNIEDVVKWLARVGTALVVLWALGTAVKVATAAMAVLNFVTAANPIGLIVLAVAALGAGIAILVKKMGGLQAVSDTIRDAFAPLGEFFSGLWSGIQATFDGMILGVLRTIDRVRDTIKSIDIGASVRGAADSVGNWVGGLFSDDEDAPGASAASPAAAVVSPQDRTARMIEERRETSTAEVTLRTERGTQAEVTRGRLGTGINLTPTGAF